MITIKKAYDFTKLPTTNTDLLYEVLTKGIQNEITKTGINKVVIGISGGIDSALSARLSIDALGKDNVIGIKMPYKNSSISSIEHADLLCKQLQIQCETEEITQMADSYIEKHQDISSLRKGNIFARLRMIVLYDKSSHHSALVLGTSNKTEILLGYSTLWGDMAHAVNPLGDLYKFQVRELSKALKIPSSIIEKPPSADLWEGQSDEEELQLTYDIADRILFNWIDRNVSKEKILESFSNIGIPKEKIERVFSLVQKSQFKRKMPVIIKTSMTTIDREFRYPRDWGL